jgi:fluoroacetyl-CoA thioesterase
MKATCEVELVAVEGRKLTFKVLCTDEKGPIGEGFHERFLIDLDRFLAKLK